LSCTARTTIPSTIERHSRPARRRFVLKMAQPAELVAAIMSAAAGQSSFSPSTMRAVHSVGEVPTARELAVLERLAHGQSTSEIAAALGIRPRTVDGHLGSLFDRVGVGGRTELVLHAVREGWIRPKPTTTADPRAGGGPQQECLSTRPRSGPVAARAGCRGGGLGGRPTSPIAGMDRHRRWHAPPSSSCRDAGCGYGEALALLNDDEAQFETALDALVRGLEASFREPGC